MSDLFPILIIEDNEEDRYILRRLIDKCVKNAFIHDCINGQDALNYLENVTENDFPKKIFLDINMPILGGFGFLEAFDKFRISNELFKKCEVAMFSTSKDYDEKKKALEYEFVVDYIEKMPSVDKIKEYLIG